MQNKTIFTSSLTFGPHIIFYFPCHIFIESDIEWNVILWKLSGG